MYPLTEIAPLWALYESLIRSQWEKGVKMVHWDSNSLNISLSKMLSRGKYEVLRRYIEEVMVANRVSLLYILNQGGSVLFYNGGSLLLYN